MTRRKIGCAAVAAMSLWVFALQAADPTARDEANLAIKADEQLASIAGAPVGDTVDLFTGVLSFQHTDVSLPGNSKLPVEVTRQFTAGLNDALPTISNLPFQTWDFNIPRITAVLAQVAPWPSNRCSSGWTPGYVNLNGRGYTSDYSQGILLKLPRSSALLLRTDASTAKAPAGSPFVAADDIYFSCTAATDMSGADAGEGYVAHMPDGTIYILNRAVNAAAKRRQSEGNADNCEPNSNLITPNLPLGLPTDLTSKLPSCVVRQLDRYTAMMYASRAIDRFGNTVDYTYDSTGRLTDITSNDGRHLQMTWTNGYVAKVTDGSRTWLYQYDNGELVKVVRPDSSLWQYQLLGLFHAKAGDPGSLTIAGLPSGVPASGSVTTPYGLKASYSIDNIANPVAGSPGTAIPVTFWTAAIQRKQLSAPGIDTQEWHYEYPNQNDGSAASSGGPVTKSTIVTDPENNKTTYIHAIEWGWKEGLLVGKSVSGADGSFESLSYTYEQTPVIGYSGVGRNAYRDSHSYRATSATTAINGDVYTVAYNAPDDYKNPRQVVQSNNFSSVARTETRSYFNSASTSLWVIGQSAGSTIGNVAMSRTTFDGLAMPRDTYNFGLRTSTKFYSGDGTLYVLADGLDRQTVFENYLRGKAQKITLPGGDVVLNRTVSASGVLSSITDGRGNTTTLGHDPMDRLTGVTYPTGDTVNWTGRSIEYGITATSELGLPAGVFRARSTLGRQRKTTYYDPTLHPLLVEQYDTTTGETRYVNSKYDFRGNLVFQSYPSSSTGSTSGVYTRYDGVGRVIRTQLSDGTVVKSIAYLSGNRQAVTDATGHTTTTTYQAFGEPSYDAPLVIVAPENQTTTYTRNVFGEVVSANRSGNGVSLTETNVYDAYHRLCKVIRPESGQHVVQYDDANQISWSASGVGGNASSCDYNSVPASERTLFTYDPRGNKTFIDYPDSSGDISLGYDADDHLTSASNSVASWSYIYNKRGLVELQTLSVDGRQLSLDPIYNALGQVDSETYPDGFNVVYAPNAWGEDTQVGSFATSIVRHPTGSIKSASFGNGLTYATTLDARQHLESQSVSSSSAALQSLTYRYNDDSQMTSVADNVDGADSATFGYDGIHRLQTANGLWGNYIYGYDPLGNLRSRSGAGALTYNYNSSNQLSTVTGGASRSYGYDARGRVTSDGRYTYVWNQADQITGEPNVAAYGYDGNAKRVRKTMVNGTAEYAFYDLGGKLRYTVTSAATVDYVDLDGKPFVEKTNGTPGTSGGGTSPLPCLKLPCLLAANTSATPSAKSNKLTASIRANSTSATSSGRAQPNSLVGPGDPKPVQDVEATINDVLASVSISALPDAVYQAKATADGVVTDVESMFTLTVLDPNPAVNALVDAAQPYVYATTYVASGVIGNTQTTINQASGAATNYVLKTASDAQKAANDVMNTPLPQPTVPPISPPNPPDIGPAVSQIRDVTSYVLVQVNSVQATAIGVLSTPVPQPQIPTVPPIPSVPSVPTLPGGSGPAGPDVTPVIYLHADWLGSPRMATNAKGEQLWREHFDPYGKKLNNVAEKRGFTGHSFDQETGLTYMLARYYDADVGRFLMTDPIGSKDDLNVYAYVVSDPISYTDPTGMQTGSNIAKDAEGVVGHGFIKNLRSDTGGSAAATPAPAASSSTAQAPTTTLTVLVESPDESSPEKLERKGMSGHAGVALEQEYWDYGPQPLQGDNIFGSPGRPWWDRSASDSGDANLKEVKSYVDDKGYHVSAFTRSVTAKQASTISTYWSKLYQNPGTYQFALHNCTTTVSDSLSAAGLGTSATRPATLANQLREGGWTESKFSAH